MITKLSLFVSSKRNGPRLLDGVRRVIPFLGMVGVIAQEIDTLFALKVDDAQYLFLLHYACPWRAR